MGTSEDSLLDKYYELSKIDTSFLSSNQKNEYTDILNFLKDGDTLYAQSLIDKEIDRINDTTVSNKEENLRKLRDLQNFLRANPICCRIEKDEKLDGKRKKIAKSSLHKIDGIESIIKALGSDEKFIELSVKASYFFEPELVKIMNGTLGEKLDHKNEQIPLPYARQSSDPKYYNNDTENNDKEIPDK